MRRFLPQVKVYLVVVFIGSIGASCRSRAIPCPSFSHRQALDGAPASATVAYPQTERFGQ